MAKISKSGNIKNKVTVKIVITKKMISQKDDSFVGVIFLVFELSINRDFFDIEMYKITKSRAVRVSINASLEA